MAADLARGDWQCPNEQCYNHTNFPNAYVYGSSVNCKKCGTGRSAQRPGDWCCPNPNCINQTNCVYGSKPVCPKCGTPKPVVGGGKGGAPAPNHMAMHMQAMAMSGKGGVAPPREGDWHCANPSCKNHTRDVVYSSKSSCPLCGMAKPDAPRMATVAAHPRQAYPQQAFGGVRMQTAVGHGARPGDWNCPNPSCKNHMGNVVYGSKEICPLCSTPKPENGACGHGATGYGAARVPAVPGSRPGDWHCPNPNCKNHTNNVVYAGKSHCPLCNTPHPDADGRVRSRSPRSTMPF